MDSTLIFPKKIAKACSAALVLWTWNAGISTINASSTRAFAPSDTVAVFGHVYQLPDRPKMDGSFTLTAYNLDKVSTGKSPGDKGFGVTATGTRASTGRTVAVDPTVIPYGSLLYIEGVGWRLAEDTGGAIRGHHIDILVDTRGTALKFGVKRNQRVEVYEPKGASPSIKEVATPVSARGSDTW